MDIRALGYLRIETTDLPAWRTYVLDLLGMTEAPGSTPGSLHVRIDDRVHRFQFVAGEQDRLLAAGFEVANARALEEAAAELEGAGFPVKQADAATLADRRVQGLIHCEDPSGNPLELYWGQAQDHTPLASPYGNRFVTGELGLGHVVLPAPETETTLAFYEDLLGFQLRDSMRLPPVAVPTGAPGRDFHWMHFLSPGRRHHSLGLYPGALPPGIVHFMVELEKLDDVGFCLDRMNRAGVPIASTLGRHSNDHMVSFYAQAPGGFQVEYGWDGLLVDPATWTAKEITADSFWGHQWNG
ncbi:Iron-dependent extradiol dioxygenase [Streptomyces lavendulae subsp. lavendulae]|uniref:Iron-dependent extradiol dioxygenase n=1 Tax=Streptomyces lavendulae subsp. lavendulae TaxID=58340 RepID=A0A2K8PKM7_STRLA|nr:VOC family protein [Streptomyces lavendulae]ATZ27279.1 Iron-dependent extradiol dioxygenase [Streptomyces lavendulae subsp. lavendulae]QUQ57106.1 Iron-dependent extradiol dioxygenase [Streptomyces lavendulae subsp. lavendulae]